MKSRFFIEDKTQYSSRFTNEVCAVARTDRFKFSFRVGPRSPWDRKLIREVGRITLVRGSRDGLLHLAGARRHSRQR